MGPRSNGDTPEDGDDPYNLARFVEAQGTVYKAVRRELSAGRKESHWMWFVFPQLAGLGRSPTARHFELRSEAEARAYLHHPILGPRLVECAEMVLGHPGLSAEIILGPVDAKKFRSSMTLFAEIADEPALFRRALETFYRGEPDPATLRLLA